MKLKITGSSCQQEYLTSERIPYCYAESVNDHHAKKDTSVYNVSHDLASRFCNFELRCW